MEWEINQETGALQRLRRWLLNAAWFPRASVQTGQDGTAARRMINTLECNRTPQHSCPSPASPSTPSPGGLPVQPALSKWPISTLSLELLSLLEPGHHFWKAVGFQSHVWVSHVGWWMERGRQDRVKGQMRGWPGAWLSITGGKGKVKRCFYEDTKKQRQPAKSYGFRAHRFTSPGHQGRKAWSEPGVTFLTKIFLLFIYF